MKEELTTKMHSEFEISEENERKLLAWTILDIIGLDSKDEEIDYFCRLYCITKYELFKYKKSWIRSNK